MCWRLHTPSASGALCSQGMRRGHSFLTLEGRAPFVNMRLLPGSHGTACLPEIAKIWADFVPNTRKDSFAMGRIGLGGHVGLRPVCTGTAWEHIKPGPKQAEALGRGPHPYLN